DVSALNPAPAGAPPAEDGQRQEQAGPVEPVEEPPFLLPCSGSPVASRSSTYSLWATRCTTVCSIRAWFPVVGEAPSELAADQRPLLHLSQQQTAAVRRDRTTVEPGHDFTLRMG